MTVTDTAALPFSSDREVGQVSRFARDTFTMTKRNLKRLARTPEIIAYSTIQPVLFVVLFNYVFGGSIEFEGRDYIDFLVPGVMIQTAMFAGGQTGIGITQDLQSGSMDRFRSLPMIRATVLFGRTIADATRSLVPSTVVYIIGFLLGFRPEAGLPILLLTLVITWTLGFAFNWVFLAMALFILNPEAVSAAAFLPVFPLVFAGSTFAPVDNMPGWLQGFASNQPVTTSVDLIRGLLFEGDVQAPLVKTLLWIVGITVVAMTLAIRRFNRI